MSSQKISDRFHKASSPDEIPQDAFVVLCYPDDEGVRNNNGRAGAAKGPERILHYLGRMPVRSGSPSIAVLEPDLLKLPLLERHERAKALVLELLKKAARVLTIGGGHDYGYPDFSALFEHNRSRIVNVDAHLDVRELDEKKPTSGTPFFRLLEAHKDLELVQWGIRSDCSADEHIEYCKKHKVKIHSYKAGLPELRDGPVGLSICLDAIEGIRGVSAPSMIGLDPKRVLDLVHRYSVSAKLMGVYECAPDLDPATEDSARLGASLSYHFIHSGRSADESRLF
jgi:arginase family enzyme